tara:strand:- start:455 stop:805 length:351 start_codon:yes stop_codon:yes gene_type:complete
MAKPPVKRKSLLSETKKKRTVADAVGKKMPKIKPKPKISSAQLKALDGLKVAGRTDDLAIKMFGGTAYGADGGLSMYLKLRSGGMSPMEAYNDVWDASRSELIEFMYGDTDFQEYR